MNYKLIVADIVAYSMKRVEMAEFDLNITQEEVYEGEIKALTGLLSHLDMLLSGNKEPDEELNHCTSLVREALEELQNGEGSKYLVGRKQS